MLIAYVDLNVLAKEIYDRTYTIVVSTCFMVKYPKYREVFAASFRDRIVHHWICMRLNPLFEFEHARLGNVSHNCRKGFGSIYSIHEVANAMRRISCNYRKEAWVYKAFIKNGRTYLSSRTLARFKERIVGFNRILDKDVVTIFDLTRIECVVNSYLGFCVRHRTYRKRRKYICMFVPSFWKYFYVKGHYQSIHIKKKITKNYISA